MATANAGGRVAIANAGEWLEESLNSLSGGCGSPGRSQGRLV